MEKFDYMQAPTDEVFEDLRQGAISVWSDYDDTHGYATEKITRVNEVTNFKDNYWTLIGMFDCNNQAKLMLRVRLDETRQLILNAISG